MKIHLIKLLILFLAISLLIGCQKEEEGTTAATKKKVELSYVEWSDAVAAVNVVKAVLQEKMGYEVELTPVGGAAMWQAVAWGDADGIVGAWLPTTHGHYLERLKDKVVDLGPNLVGTKIGLVVPTYVTIDSITQLKENVERFDGKIIGLDPGAGIMSKTEKVMEKYGLEDYTLVEGSGATMTAALGAAIDNKEWIVIPGWTPHWMFARWDLKYLDDPKNIYGGEEEIRTIVRQGLKEEAPEVYQLLDAFHWTPEDLQQVMVWNSQKGSSPYENAKRWISENPEKVEAWIP